jgi:proteic killer suppression protein
MIVSFGSKETRLIWEGEPVNNFMVELQDLVRRKLLMIDVAQDLSDLRSPAGNRLEKLRGDLNGYHSIRVNKRWRIIFRWNDGEVLDVELIDYH